MREVQEVSPRDRGETLALRLTRSSTYKRHDVAEESKEGDGETKRGGRTGEEVQTGMFLRALGKDLG